MKLVYLMRYWPVFGGGETVMRTLANEMCRRNHEVYIIYLWDRTNDLEVKLRSEVQSIRIQGIPDAYNGDIKRGEYNKIAGELHEIFCSINPDVVINQWMPTKMVFKAMRGLPIPLIKCHHGVIKWIPIIKTLKQRLFYGLLGDKAGWIRVLPEYSKDYRYSDMWVLLSQASYRDAKYLLPWADDARLAVIPNPLPFEIDENKYSIDIKKKKKEVIYVGRVIPLKRVSYLLDAWKIVEEKITDWSFRIIGDGDCIDEEKKHALQIGLKNVIFEGYRDAKEYMRNAAMLLFASSQEGFGMAVIEAQFLGCVPVVTKSYPTVHDLIEDGKNGRLVEDNNVGKFADAIIELILDEHLREQMAINAIKSSMRYNVEDICDLWEELFSSLVIRRG